MYGRQVDNALAVRPSEQLDNVATAQIPLFRPAYLVHAQSSYTTKRYLEIGRAGYVEVGDEAMYVGEDTVTLLSDAVQADDGDDLLCRLLLRRLASGWVNLDALARGHV